MLQDLTQETGSRKKPSGLLPGSDDRPADILHPFWEQGKDAALDICVVNPLQGTLVERVAEEGKAAGCHRSGTKMSKYRDRCDQGGLSFIPIAVDTFGGWHPTSLDALSKLGRQVATRWGGRKTRSCDSSAKG